MVLAGYAVELLFGLLHWVPSRAVGAAMEESGISWNYTTWLNILFLALAAVLVFRFVRTGGIPMLRMMGGSPENHLSH
jgi:hypothetical protein